MTMLRNIILIVVVSTALSLGIAHGQMFTSDLGSNNQWNWDISNMYQVHQVHVGDRIYFTNTDTHVHSIRGQDTGGEIFQSSAIQPGGQYEMTFLFPGNFTFYDEYNTNDFGVIYIYEKDQGFPIITNYTATRNSYQGTPYYSNLATSNPVLLPDPSSDSTTSPTTAPGTSSLTLNGTSNSTLAFTDNSNATYWYNQAQYYQSQSNFWESKYDNILVSIKSLLGI